MFHRKQILFVANGFSRGRIHSLHYCRGSFSWIKYDASDSWPRETIRTHCTHAKELEIICFRSRESTLFVDRLSGSKRRRLTTCAEGLWQCITGGSVGRFRAGPCLSRVWVGGGPLAQGAPLLSLSLTLSISSSLFDLLSLLSLLGLLGNTFIS